MGGYKRHNATVYIVEWPDGVVKAGWTERQRWRKFVLLGATVLELYEFPSFTEAFAFESAAHQWLRANGELAFSTLEESREYVGPDGGGYAECFRIAPGTDAQALLRHMLTLCAEHCPSSA